MDIGVIGWNSHVAEMRRLKPGLRLIAQRHPDLPDDDAELCIPVVESLADHLDRLDGALVMERRAEDRAGLVRPLLRAGLRVFVDKPLALRVDEADAMLADAQAGALMSFSALRWLPATRSWRRLIARHDGPWQLTVRGPADPGSPHGGIAFYGIHTIELALELVGAVRDVRASRLSDDGVALDFRAGGGSVSVRFGPAEPAFSVSISGAEDGRGTRRDGAPGGDGGDVTGGVIELGADYYRGAASRIVRFFRGRAPLTVAQLREPVELLEAALTAQANWSG